MLCRSHLGEIRDSWNLFQNTSAAVVAVTFSPFGDALKIQNELRLPFPVVSNPSRSLYLSLGMEKIRWIDFLNLKLASEGWKKVCRGWWPSFGYDKSDLRQLGGDVIVDKQEKILFQFISKSPEQRPGIVELINIFKMLKEQAV
ncbi:MAG: AhpC/TSA family protein [Planctomycetia bacterium]